ncbi:MAG TPA: FAD-linked oxidase C-terminal domain-containing protein [Microbacterium sp.]|nr:FAD-linked oxidase C-terminal domain-containing protein [Microbacterium sp.]
MTSAVGDGAERPSPAPPMQWDAWGDGSRAAHLPPGAKQILALVLKGKPRGIARRAAEAATLTPSRLDVASLNELATLAPTTADDAVRILHLGGRSTPDLLARRRDEVQAAPDAVVSPEDHTQTLAVLAHCAEHDIVVVPFGGGTSVVGGVDPDAGGHRAVITLDLSRTAGLIALDEVSLLATFGAGTTGPQAEELLSRHGLTLGHFPQSFEFASLGGFAATRSSGQASRGYGRFDDLVHALVVATPVGELRLGRAPASAAGPDLRELILGSEGAFGVITEVTVRVRLKPTRTAYASWTFPDFDAGAEALREATQRGIQPTVVRLSDETETRINAVMGGHLTRMNGCLAIATADGATADGDEGAAELARLDEVFRAHGAKPRGEDPARSWERGRFDAPGLRDTLMDIGVLAETLETATIWAALPELKAAVTAALTDALDGRPQIMCHISHVYPAGASLYFTVIAPLDADPVAQWARAKDAASRAIVASGGTITHHHAVGTDHRSYLTEEIGDLGVEVLRAVKRTLDPRGILNPGKLIP